jgi:SAM-dependent methyltransferase
MIANTATVVSPPRDSVRHLARWAVASCEPGPRVLNIGAGADRSGGLGPLATLSPYLVGVDPDDAILRNQSLRERHQMSVEEFARDHAAEFDVAVALYVLEHVTDPAAFAAACARVLRPGGAFFAVTLNVRQYFGATTWALSRIGMTDRLLVSLKGGEEVHGHHFPPEYKLNSIRSVTRHFGAAGFRSAEFRCYDATERYAWYLPASLRWFPTVYTRFAYAVGSPALMGHLSFRLVR